jgi:hypothetical protein
VDWLADLLSASSNRLAEILEDWNKVLQKSSLGQNLPDNEIEGKDGSAPRVSRPAAVRRRRTA